MPETDTHQLNSSSAVGASRNELMPCSDQEINLFLEGDTGKRFCKEIEEGRKNNRMLAEMERRITTVTPEQLSKRFTI